VIVRAEAMIAVVVAAYSAIAGGVAGIVWEQLGAGAPLITMKGGLYIESYKFLLGDDVTFGLVALVAGLVVALAVVVVGRDAGTGPGAVIGLAVGGVLGALVAAHVGHELGHQALVSRVLADAPGANPTTVGKSVSGYDFTLHWRIGLVTWPFAAVGVIAGVAALRGGEQPAGGWSSVGAGR
jgi:hypothetical protein